MGEKKAQIEFVAGSEAMGTALERADLVVLDISRQEVESGNIGPAQDRLLNLTDTPANIHKFASSLVLMFSGYDDDPRELDQVPGVAAYMRRLNEFWPYWFHYLIKDSSVLGLVVKLLSNAVRDPARPGVVEIDEEALKRTLTHLVAAVYSLHHAAGLDEAYSAQMIAAALDQFGKELQS